MWFLTINLAGLGVRVEADPALAPVLLQEPLARFAADVPVALRLSLGLAPDVDWPVSRERVVYTDEAVEFDLHNVRGILDRRARHMTGLIPAAELASVALRRMLMVAAQFVLLDVGGLLLRAAAVDVSGTCLVFPGPSGAGKTTLMHLALAAGHAVLGDEAVLLRRQGGRWMAYSFPYWEPGVNVRRAVARPLAAAVGGLVHPVHAPVCTVERLTAPCMMLHLMETENVLLTTPADSQRWLDVAHDLTQEVPAIQLRFHPTTDVWRILRTAVSFKT